MLYKYSWHQFESVEDNHIIEILFQFNDGSDHGLGKHSCVTYIPCIIKEDIITKISISNSSNDNNESKLFAEGIECFNNGEFENSAKW